MDPYNNTKDIFNFFGFSFHKNVIEFLDTHTKTNIGGVSSTFRDSKTAPFKWRERLKKEEVLEIQVTLTGQNNLYTNNVIFLRQNAKKQ